MRTVPKRAPLGGAREPLPPAELPTPAQLVVEMERISAEAEAIKAELPQRSEAWARAKREYMKARAKRTLIAGEEVRQRYGLDKPSVAEKDAWVDLETADLCFEADLAKRMMYAAWSALKLRESQLSALQTIAGTVRAELDLAGKGPNMAP